MTGRSAANELFGKYTVARALLDYDPQAITSGLVDDMRQHMTTARDLELWAHELHWTNFCAVVAIISGRHRENILNYKTD